MENEKTVFKKRSQAREVWRRFCRNKQAMVGMCMLLLLIFAAVFADLIAPSCTALSSPLVRDR